MNIQQMIPVFVKLFLSFVSAFSAIALWSKTRNPAWVLIVLAAIMFFVDVLYAALVMLGVADYSILKIAGFELLAPLLSGIPYILLTSGFLVYIFREKRY